MSWCIGRRERAGLVLSLSCFVGASGAAPQEPELGVALGSAWAIREVPAAVLEAARGGSVLGLASALARARVVTGTVVSADDWLDMRQPPGADAAGRSVPLGAALDVFAKHRTGHVVRELDGALLVLPTPVPACAAHLARRIQALDAEGAAFEVQYQLVRAANRDRSPYVPPGLMRSGTRGLDQPWPPEEDDGVLYRSLVTLHLRDVSVAEALNALVRQVPGLGWALVERYGSDTRGSVVGRESHASPRPKLPCTVELVGPNGMTSGSHVLRVPFP